MNKGFVNVFIITETKLDGSFPGGQFFMEGYNKPSRFDRNGNGGGILLYVREDIPAKVIHPFYIQVFMLKLVFIRKNGC